MSKINRVHWTYVGNKVNSLVEIKHFLESGNLAIFCNQQIIITDFEVFGDAEYAFFIEEEFCRISIKKHKDGQLGYNFEIVADIDTPLNRFRKKISRKYLIQSILAIIGVVLLIAVLIAGGYLLNQHHLNKDLRENGIVKPIQVKVKPHVHEGKFYNAYYTFKYKNRHQSKHLKLPANTAQELITPNGLSLRDNDEFLLTFSSKKSSNHRIDFKSPTEKQIKTYRARILSKMDTDSSNIRQNNCFLNAVYQTKGISAWADIYYQNISSKNNKNHHRDSYQKLMQDPKIQELKSNCDK